MPTKCSTLPDESVPSIIDSLNPGTSGAFTQMSQHAFPRLTTKVRSILQEHFESKKGILEVNLRNHRIQDSDFEDGSLEKVDISMFRRGV